MGDWATPEIMVARGFTPVGGDFPVFLHPRTHEEYALARTERKSGRGYHGFVFHAGQDVTLADDLQRRDLTVNAIAPGYIATEMTDSLSDKVQEEIINAIPMKRKGTTEDIANLTLFLASDKAAYITGQVIVVDGGMSV